MTSSAQLSKQRFTRALQGFHEIVEFFWRLLSVSRYKRLSVIEDQQLIDLMQRTNQWDALQTGMLNCSACGVKLSMNNIAGFSKKSGSYRFFCDGVGCSSSIISSAK
jgi:hypothetical protein